MVGESILTDDLKKKKNLVMHTYQRKHIDSAEVCITYFMAQNP